MKKIIMLVATVFCLAVAASAFAGTSVDCAFATTGQSLHGDKTTATASTTLIGKASTGVCVGVLTGILGYAMNTQHKRGSKAFGASFDSTTIYAATAVVGSVFMAQPTLSNSAAFSTGWESM